MTLTQLAKMDPRAFKAWVVGLSPGVAGLSFRTTRVYKVNGRLFLIWNSNLYYAAYKWTGRSWRHFVRAPRGKWYAQGVKTLRRHDSPNGVYPPGVQ